MRPLCKYHLWSHKWELVNFTDHSAWYRCGRLGCPGFKIEKLAAAPKEGH